MSDLNQIDTKRISLLVVIGSGSALAQEVVSMIDGCDKLIPLSTKGGSIKFDNSEQDLIRYPGADFSSLRSVCDSAIFPSRAQLQSVKIISFTGVADTGLLVSMTEMEMRQIVDANLLVNSMIASLLIKKYRGLPMSFVFISSTRALVGDLGVIMYSATKHALNGLVRGISLEYGRFSINANVLSLGILPFGLINSVPEKRLKEMIKRTANKRFVEISSVAKSINFLFDNKDVNGAVVHCDGGYS